jgi:hypothetical protein
MCIYQSMACFPLHVFGFFPIGIGNTKLPVELIPNLTGASKATIVSSFSLATVGKFITLTAGKVPFLKPMSMDKCFTL